MSLAALECQKCHLAWHLAASSAAWVTTAATPPDCDHQEPAVTDPAAMMRRAADHIRRLGVDVVYDAFADWLDDAANESAEVGASAYAEKVAAAVLGEPDPYPLVGPPVRPAPEAAVTHVEGAPQ